MKQLLQKYKEACKYADPSSKPEGVPFIWDNWSYFNTEQHILKAKLKIEWTKYKSFEDAVKRIDDLNLPNGRGYASTLLELELDKWLEEQLESLED